MPSIRRNSGVLIRLVALLYLVIRTGLISNGPILQDITDPYNSAQYTIQILCLASHAVTPYTHLMVSIV